MGQVGKRFFPCEDSAPPFRSVDREFAMSMIASALEPRNDAGNEILNRRNQLSLCRTICRALGWGPCAKVICVPSYGTEMNGNPCLLDFFTGKWLLTSIGGASWTGRVFG